LAELYRHQFLNNKKAEKYYKLGVKIKMLMQLISSPIFIKRLKRKKQRKSKNYLKKQLNLVMKM